MGSLFRRSIASPMLLALLLVVWGSATRDSALAVILMRHGHQAVAQADGNRSPQGQDWVQALARLIPACFVRPIGILGYAFNPRSGNNARSDQTLVPLAVATGPGWSAMVPITSDDFDQLLRQSVPLRQSSALGLRAGARAGLRSPPGR